MLLSAYRSPTRLHSTYPHTTVTSTNMESGLVCEANGTPVVQLPMLMIQGKSQVELYGVPG